MTQPSRDTELDEADEAAARKRTERLLVFIVSFLGLLIVAGITAVVLRIIYLRLQGLRRRWPGFRRRSGSTCRQAPSSNPSR
jgi:flagellar basal body-associated protein FliL